MHFCAMKTIALKLIRRQSLLSMCHNLVQCSGQIAEARCNMLVRLLIDCDVSGDNLALRPGCMLMLISHKCNRWPSLIRNAERSSSAFPLSFQQCAG